ncbi:MAG: hypothetical protein HYR66_15675 [Sphingobacteriales bacterium]|nr:hypothetical protein [Sphingobacteriales bacterium]MBI3717355.1 hypothetical protein [Sphingobacteriales bacterium]
MRRPLIIIIATFSFLATYSQSPVDFSKFTVEQSDTATLSTTDLLNKINWQAIKTYCTGDNGHYAYERKDSLLTTYEYVKQGREASFEITSYKGMIMEFYSDAGNSSKQGSTSFFGKNVWLKYVSEIIPSLPEQFKLDNREPGNILKAYYKLLGINTRDEYGFICEYSTIGIATDRRIVVITLLKQHRIDLLKKLTDYSNLQTRLYAVDALIYNDYTAKQKILQLTKNLKEKQKELDLLQKKNANKTKIDELKIQIKASLDSISNSNSDLLTEAEWKTIYNLRDSNLTVKTCGNSGSYKIYGTPISDLLSDKAIAEIPKWYEGLKRLGYFR